MDCRQVKGSLNSQFSVNLTEADIQAYFQPRCHFTFAGVTDSQAKGHVEESSNTSTTWSKYICAVTYSISKCRILYNH